ASFASGPSCSPTYCVNLKIFPTTPSSAWRARSVTGLGEPHDERMTKIPNDNRQITNKFEMPKHKRPTRPEPRFAWFLFFGACLGFVICVLRFVAAFTPDPLRTTMIELRNDALVFHFPEVHPHAGLTINFQRTLRIPDDGRTYPLPPGLGSFPLRHVDDFARRVPGDWIEHGGVMLPMYQAEAMWLYFHADYAPRRGSYPFAIKVATGKIDAVSGKSWAPGLHRRPQDYMVAPHQPWLDGYCVTKGTIRQFVAMPLGQGYTAEEQITGQAEHGGLQIMVYPMRREVFERRFPEQVEKAMPFPMRKLRCAAPASAAMGLAPGGRMKQEIYEDPFDLDDWDTAHTGRCFVHI